MVFSGLTFLQYFLTCVLVVYYLVPKAWKNTMLFVFSPVFYAGDESICVGLLICEKLFLLKCLNRLPAAVGHVYTSLCVAIGWVLFVFENFGAGFAYLKVMFGFGGTLANNPSLYRLLSCAPLLVVCAVAATPLRARCAERILRIPSRVLPAGLEVGGVAAVSLLSVA